MVKKVIVLILCFACLLCGCSGGDGGLKIWLKDASCKPGETVKVEIYISKNSGVAASDLIITFDNTQLAYEGFEAGSVYTSEAAAQNETSVKVTSITLDPPAQETLMGTVLFKALSTASGETTLELTSETCADYDLADLTPTCQNATVTIG